MAPNPKRRKVSAVRKDPAVEEVVFDTTARQEYLTGFHKRKLERARHAREVAEKKARAERIADRKRLREERKAELERHVEQVNAQLLEVHRPENNATSDSEEVEHSDDSDDEEWNGIENLPPQPIDHEAEYIDEDRYTTVTVEEMDLSKEGIHRAELAAEGSDDDSEGQGQEEGVDGAGGGSGARQSTNGKKRIWTKVKPAGEMKKPKIKKKKFRYESKAERKLTRSKERLKNSRQAKARREQ